MTSQTNTTAGKAELDAARLMLARMGISAADLLHGTSHRQPAPTFAEHVPIVSNAVSDTSRRVWLVLEEDRAAVGRAASG
jgi:integrase/recombinase XerC